MADKDNPQWGSDEFNKAIEEHDKKEDPKREDKKLKYTKKDDGGPKGGKKK